MSGASLQNPLPASLAGAPSQVSEERFAAAGPLARRALHALAASMMCFAALHVAILAVHAAIHGDATAFNLFTMVEAQRLWPALATGGTARECALGLGFVVYGAAFAALAHPRPRGLERRAVPRPRPVAIEQTGVRVSPAFGWCALVSGITLHMSALAAIGRLVREFPSVPDVVHARLPYVDFGVPGELCFAAFLASIIVVLYRTQPRTVPAVLTLLGLFYSVRGVFLFLLPIGMPPTAPPLGARFVFWPFAGHAYFPGGHTGMMTVLSLSVVSRPWRRAFLAFTCAFAICTLLARTHYAADAVGGWLVAYAIVLWGRGRFGVLAGGACGETS